MNFIKLTETNGDAIYVNMSLATLVNDFRQSGGAHIGLNNEDAICVKESAEEVMKKISDVSSTGGGS